MFKEITSQEYKRRIAPLMEYDGKLPLVNDEKQIAADYFMRL